MTTRARDFKFAGTPVQRLQLAMVALTHFSEICLVFSWRVTYTMEEVDENPMVEVLFEYKGSGKALIFQVSAVCDGVEQELRDLGVTEPS